MLGYHLETTWGQKKNLKLFIKVSCLGEMYMYRAIFSMCTLLPTGLSAKGKEEYIMAYLHPQDSKGVQYRSWGV